ncbi:stimulated by retinoic acid gene 8 protein homolog isoform X4 [Hemicordylus capensis]|uniref:stimulated by retinoic acid gene 8 protein homolog isoform X4 n=1 Tax=Hemicordylus capensis TaxID=884348 RepID=UPI002302FBBC|nr:stimulated by retinoic acid gene 8 protein homolog isoform X4 [Hemicordylus capensis]
MASSSGKLLMETSGNCSTPYARLTTHLQDLEPRVGKRRLSQARHRATLAGLFNNLRESVYSQKNNSASKCQVLCKAKNYIQELEQTLENLLNMKEVLNLEDGNPSSLEEVKEEYVKMYFNHHRYLYFYKQTVDLLVDNGIVNPEEVILPVVSTAVSHLWQGLPEERRDSVLLYCSQRQNFISEVKTASQEPACTEGSMRDSGTNSQEASGSLVSTPEEFLFEDAFDVATSFLDINETQEISSQSSTFTGCASESQEDHQHLYLKIITFLKSLFFANTQAPQEEVLQLDYETVMLRCTETFDDEDL